MATGRASSESRGSGGDGHSPERNLVVSPCLLPSPEEALQTPQVTRKPAEGDRTTAPDGRSGPRRAVRLNVQCGVCSKEMVVRACDVARGRGRFCGRPCRDEAAGRKRIGRVMPPDALARFMAKVAVRADSGCWEWQGYLACRSGYALLRRRSGNLKAYRVAYEHFVGPIPVGPEIDHLCCNRLCVNPAHLEPVTPAQNKARTKYRSRACRRGHAWTQENTYFRALRNGNFDRVCRACHAASSRRSTARRRAA